MSDISPHLNHTAEPSQPETITPGSRNIPDSIDLPIVSRTANLRYGPNLNDSLLSLLPLVGIWRGTGQAVRTITSDAVHELAFGQEIIISHDGDNYLQWESVIWEIPATENITEDDAEDAPADASFPILTREVGFLRIAAQEQLELILTHSDGFAEIYYGHPRTITSWEFATDVVIQTKESAHQVSAAKRLYGIVEGSLAYVEERANEHGEFSPTYSAQLFRWAG